jgi:hypothetical protein
MKDPIPFPKGDDATFGGGLSYISELLAIQIRNLEAMRLAQQKMLEGMGVLARHQVEMAGGALSRSFAAQPSVLASGSDIRAAIAGQIEALKTAIKEGQSNSNVLSELAARSSGDVANTLQTRMMAALDEFKAALEHAMPDSAGAGPPPAVTVQPSWS